MASLPCLSQPQFGVHQPIAVVVVNRKSDSSSDALHLPILWSDHRDDARQSLIAPDSHKATEELCAEPLSLLFVDDDERKLGIGGAADLRQSSNTQNRCAPVPVTPLGDERNLPRVIDEAHTS